MNEFSGFKAQYNRGDRWQVIEGDNCKIEDKNDEAREKRREGTLGLVFHNALAQKFRQSSIQMQENVY